VSGQPPPGIDASVAHIARVYNFWLGGEHNYPADRAAAEQVRASYPDILASIRAQRAFLGRAVRYLAAEAGIRQFLDLGTGLPAPANTHEVAQRVAPRARVVFVDNDPLVARYADALRSSSPQGDTAYIEADVRDTAAIVRRAAATLDFGRPVAVILVGVLHCIPDDDDPAGVVARLLAAAAPGSYLVIAHPASDVKTDQVMDAEQRLNSVMAGQVTLRTAAEVGGFLDRLDLVDPGLVQVHRWRPDAGAPVPGPELANYGAVGRKP
jgi:O-methyltransferase involved in polyketide biosynthesis